MVHVYAMNGIKLAVDSNSGGIHILDEVAYALLTRFQSPFSWTQAAEELQEQYPEEVIKEAWEEIERLVKEGLLFSPEIDRAVAASHPASATGTLKALCLHVAHDCNLRCAYCFASKGNYQSEKQLMPAETAFKALDFLVHNSGRKENIEIDFFGGEPLLNFPVVKKTVQYGRQLEKQTGKRFHFTITTNGTLLDEDTIRYINDNMDNVVLSLDGRKEVHDAIRPAASGRGSYDRIVDDALRLVRARESKSYFIRGTFTAANTDFSNDALHLASLGFDEISLEPVVGQGEDFHLRREHLPDILAEYERLAYAYIERIELGKPFRFYHFNVDIYKGPCLYKRTAACGAGTEYLAVTPTGELYPCHQFVGQQAFMVGNLDSGLQNRQLREAFAQANIFNKESCRACWAKLYCSGGCHANAHFSNGDILQPEELVCAMQKKRLECAIMIEAWKALQGKS